MAVDKKHKSCEERIDERLKRRINQFKEAMKSADEKDGRVITDGYDCEDLVEWLNNISLSYEDDSYYRAKKLLLSIGGPEDGFRFFDNFDRIEYFYKNWFDGAIRELYGEDKEVIQKFYDRCLDSGE